MRLGKTALVSIVAPVTAVAAWPEHPWISIGVAAAVVISLVVLLIVFVSREEL
jgi:hypothetical protein